MSIDKYMLTFERLLKAYEAMSAEERTELQAWEKDNLPERNTSDWPKWEEIIKRISH